MEATKVGIREFRAGLADYIESDKPVAVTRHGHTVGIFIPTHGHTQADLLALKLATAKLEALLTLGESEIEAVISDIEADRKLAVSARRGT